VNIDPSLLFLPKNNYTTLDWNFDAKIVYFNASYECALPLFTNALNAHNSSSCTDRDSNVKMIEEIYIDLVECLLRAAAVSVATKKFNISRKHW